jgi:signal transduction histidine kinase
VSFTGKDFWHSAYPYFHRTKDQIERRSATQPFHAAMTTSQFPMSMPKAHIDSSHSFPRWIERFLRVPLVAKIAGANGIILAAALITGVLALWGGRDANPRLAIILATALVLASIVNVTLVIVALRPLNDLEVTAQRIWRGDMEARVPRSRIADTDLLRIGSAVNALLDALIKDRTRLHAMASHVLQAGDTERARIASELHDSVAQTVAGLSYELSAVASSNRDAELAPRLERARRIAGGVLDEIKMLAHTMHPRVLEDGDLVSALRHLSREVQQRTGIPVRVTVNGDVTAIEKQWTAALYRVALEAVTNAVRHGSPQDVGISVNAQGKLIRLEVVDDGVGFDVEEAEGNHPGMGIETMRERAALMGGGLEIQSSKGQQAGTRIVVTIPIQPAAKAARVEADGTPASAAKREGSSSHDW